MNIAKAQREGEPDDSEMYGSDMMQLEKMKKYFASSFHLPKMRFGMRVPNFWAAAAAGNCDSVIFGTFYIKNRRENIRVTRVKFDDWLRYMILNRDTAKFE